LLGMAGWHMTGADNLLPQNQQLAFQLVREAADSGLARAQYTIGYFYEEGIGTPKNLDLAFKFYESAAQLGNYEGNLISR
jgi:TPR repeat protein